MERTNVLCKASAKKLALGQCVRNPASLRWEQEYGDRKRRRAGTFKPFIPSRIKCN